MIYVNYIPIKLGEKRKVKKKKRNKSKKKSKKEEKKEKVILKPVASTSPGSLLEI